MGLRTYSMALIAVAVGLFLAVIATNLIVDPEEVLGTGLLGHSVNPNGRYTAMRAYEAAPDEFDGLLFGSSRTWSMPLDVLSQRMGGVKFAHFGVSDGQIVDHLPVLEYVIRSKAVRGQALRAVFLLLDADIFGAPPHANQSIQALWPPVLTGESPWRFSWRYLTAIQFKAWSLQITHPWPVLPLIVPGTVRSAWSPISVASAAEQAGPGAPAQKYENARERITARDDFPRQLALLAHFVELCRTHHITLVVGIAPLHRNLAVLYDPDDLAEVPARIAAIVPVWDFGAPEWLSARTDLWVEWFHFKSELARMILDRIFTGAASGAPPDFGVLRGK